MRSLLCRSRGVSSLWPDVRQDPPVTVDGNATHRGRPVEHVAGTIPSRPMHRLPGQKCLIVSEYGSMVRTTDAVRQS